LKARASGRGKIVSYSLVRRAQRSDEVSIVLAGVALEEGALILARLIAVPPG